MIQALLSLIIFLWPALAWASPGDIQETEELGFIEIGDVYAAAKHLQHIKDAPSSITLVTDEDIRRYGHRQLTDVVNNVPGFYTYSDRNYDFIGVRGFARLGDYGNRVLQLVDGHSRVESWRSSQMVLSPAPPHQTVRSVFPNTAFQSSSSRGFRFRLAFWYSFHRSSRNIWSL